MKLIFENNWIKIFDTMHDYDFKYVIENKKNQDINIYLNGMDDYIEIIKNDWIGLLVGDYSCEIVKYLQENNGDYSTIKGGNYENN